MEILNAVTALSALAQENRLEIFRLLVRVGIEGLSAGKIGEQRDIPLSTLSFHLSQLKNAGLLKCRRDGRTLYYSVNYSSMNELMVYFTEICCQGNPASCDVSTDCADEPRTG